MKLIDLLLKLYPGDFRWRFGREMRSFHEERARERGGGGLRVVADHLLSAIAEQWRAVRHDSRFAFRSMARRPGFTALVMLTIGLGIGANSAIFSVVNAVLLRPLPYPDAGRIVTFGHKPPQWLLSEPQYAMYRRLGSFQSLAAFTTGEANLSGEGDPERIGIAQVTRDFFATLGTMPAMGRIFEPEEGRVRPSGVVIISHDLWQRHFGADPGVVGSTFRLNGIARTIIGVMPRGFAYPSRETEIWLPACTQRTCATLGESVDSMAGWANHYLWSVGRLKPGRPLDAVREEATALARQMVRDNPENFDPTSPLTPDIRTLADTMVGQARPFLIALLGAVGVVLLIVCVNVAHLLLARAEGRRQEMALRTALGASRRRLMTQMLTEALALALGGGVLGLGIAWAGIRLLSSLAPASLPRANEIGMDWVVVLFCFAVALIAGLLFGLVPALRAAREAPATALAWGGKGLAFGGGARARKALVVAEVALAVIVLSGAGMLTRSLVRLHRSDIGFNAEGALTARVSPTSNGYSDEGVVQFYEQLLERVRATPGVTAAGAARWLPVVDAGGLWDIRIEGRDFPPPRTPTAVPQEVTPGWFGAMGLRLVEGRDFTAQDRLGAPLVGVVSRSMARAYWGDASPLGRRYRLGGKDSAWVTVVGVVSDIRSRGYSDTPEPTMYLPHAQSSAGSYFVPRSMAVVARTGGDPALLEAPVRAIVRSLNGGVPVSRVQTLEDVMGTSTANRRFTTALIGGFALLALLLAGIGIYGVISYGVSERSHEIGVRMALGAQRRQVIGLVVGSAGSLAGTGLAIGLAGTIALARAGQSMLYEVGVVDAGTIIPVAIVLITVALAAAFVPARRAASADPTRALRGG